MERDNATADPSSKMLAILRDMDRKIDEIHADLHTCGETMDRIIAKTNVCNESMWRRMELRDA